MATTVVDQIPPGKAAEFKPKGGRPRRYPEEFAIVSQILDAATQAERAAMVLRLTDDLVLGRGDRLKDACTASGFQVGAVYIELRISACIAVRDREGNLPDRISRPLEIWRAGLVAVAGGMTV